MLQEPPRHSSWTDPKVGRLNLSCGSLLDAVEGQEWFAQAGLERLTAASTSCSAAVVAGNDDDDNYAAGW